MSPLYERQYHAAQMILALLRALEPLGALQSVYQAAEEVVRDLGPHQAPDDEPVFTPTLYQGPDWMINYEPVCMICRRPGPCYSVLGSYKQGGHFLSDNQMVCRGCLAKGESA